jgi:RHS repeat-associated protein
MKPRLRSIALAACLAWLLPLTSQAFYNPGTGRWLSRDPLGVAPPTQTAMLRHEQENLLRFANNNPIGQVDRVGLATLRVEVKRDVDQAEIGGYADTSWPSWTDLIPGYGACRNPFRARFHSDSISYTSVMRFSRDHPPEAPNPYAPPPTMRDHEQVHADHLQEYLESVEGLLQGINATKCVCWRCFEAKFTYFGSANQRNYYLARAKTFRFDCSQYGGYCEEAEWSQKMTDRLIGFIRTSRVQMAEAFGFAPD